MKVSLGQHIPLHECQTAAELARKIVPFHEAIGAPGMPPDTTTPTVEGVYFDPIGGTDGGPAIISPGEEDGDPPVIVIGEGGLINITSSGGGGQGHTAGAAMAIITDPANAEKDLFTGECDNTENVMLGYTNTDIGQQPAAAEKMTIKWTDMEDHAIDKDQVLSHTKGGVSKPKWVAIPFIAYCLAAEDAEVDSDRFICSPSFWFLGPPDDPPAQFGVENVFNWKVNEGKPVIAISWRDADGDLKWYPIQALAACPSD